jgi:catechol 2,3-dioxygenase-like lactoylglutathione lyase family enzyme
VAQVVKRLDHQIVAVRDRREWIPRIQRVLALEPGRMLEGSGEAASAFSNAEFAIGDGFLGVVEPSGEASQLNRFLDRFGEGFYGMSIDVGDVPRAMEAFDACGVPCRGAPPGLVWLGPRGTHGVLYQVIDGMLLGPGANPNFQGLASMTIAVSGLAQATADYRALFGFDEPALVTDERFGFRSAVLAIDASELANTIVLAEPLDAATAVGEHLATRGEGIFSFGIAVSDLDRELDRLAGIGVTAATVDGPLGRRALVDPAALGGLRVELVAS